MALGDKVVAGYMLLGAVEGPENMAEGDQLLTEMNQEIKTMNVLLHRHVNPYNRKSGNS